MNIKQCVPLEKDDVEFPSPTGVTYYEYYGNKVRIRINQSEFPSPTGVTYYEYDLHIYEFDVTCFRPQQGLPIMNKV